MSTEEVKGPTCSSCKFYKPGAQLGAGECRRFPPQTVGMPHPANGQFCLNNVFPTIAGTSFCGEHATKVLFNS